MSRAWERYTHYYLEYTQQHSNDWAWFDNEWPQIQRAWEWVSEQDNHEALVLNFVWALRLYQEQRQLWPTQNEWTKRGLQAAESCGQRDDEGKLLYSIGNTCQQLERYDQALNYYHRALPVLEDVGNRLGLTVTLGHISRVYERLGQWHQAIDFYQQTLQIQEEIGDEANLAAVLNNIGHNHNNLA